MSNELDRIDRAEAAEALGSVEEMRHAALRRGVPPRWLGVTIAAWIGGMWASGTSGGSGGALGLWTAFFVIVVVLKRRALVSLAKNLRLDISIRIIAAQIATLLILVALLRVSRAGWEASGSAWVPLVTGLLAALTIYALFEFKRHVIRTRIEAEYPQ